MAEYIVGDVHGRLETLHKLCKKLGFSPNHDKLIFVGDLVNRGEQSIETVEFVRSLGTAADSILGNHDLYFLACAHGGLTARSSDRFEAMLRHPASDRVIEYLRKRPLVLVHRRQRICVVHAGIPPFWGMIELQLRAGFAAARLRSSRPRVYRGMLEAVVREGTLSRPVYHSRWNYLSHDQAAYTLNSLTQLRICDSRGVIPVGSKAEQRLQDSSHGRFLPWYERYARRFPHPRYKVCFGHWAKLGGLYKPPFYGLDTNCGGGDRLSALNAATMEITSVRCVD
ncbi:MAG: symmetrical bis(5'-nucleosyl)-tetraphosphatase [Spirochaeta sp.]